MKKHISQWERGSDVQFGLCKRPERVQGGGGQTGFRTVFSDEDSEKRRGDPPTGFRRGFPLTVKNVDLQILVLKKPCLTGLPTPSPYE